MLEYIWFVTLMLVSVALAVIYSIKGDEADYEDDVFSVFQLLLGSIIAAVMALAISWERTDAVVLSALRTSLPQQGTPISELTAYALIGIACLTVVFAIPAGASFLTYFVRSKSSTTRN